MYMTKNELTHYVQKIILYRRGFVQLTVVSFHDKT